MPWDEFCTYLSGLNEKTPLGAIVAVRSETDPEIVKKMTPEQKRIRHEWVTKHLPKYSEKDYNKEMDNIYSALVSQFSK